MVIELNEQQYAVDETTNAPANLKDAKEINLQQRPGVSRTYQATDGKIILEYFNRRYLLFPSRKVYDTLQKVEFLSLGYPRDIDRFTYLYRIDDAAYDKLRPTASPIAVPNEVASLGDITRLPNGSLLFKGKMYWAAGNNFVFQGLETFVAMDMELIHFLEEAANLPLFNTSTLSKAANNEQLSYQLQNEAGRVSNIDAARFIINEQLNIKMEHLDFTKASLNTIDASWFWNRHNVDEYAMLEPCLAYVAECILQSHSDWRIEAKSGQCYITTPQGLQSDIGAYITRLMIDSDFGLPEVRPAYESVIMDLNK